MIHIRLYEYILFAQLSSKKKYFIVIGSFIVPRVHRVHDVFMKVTTIPLGAFRPTNNITGLDIAFTIRTMSERYIYYIMIMIIINMVVSLMVLSFDKIL